MCASLLVCLSRLLEMELEYYIGCVLLDGEDLYAFTCLIFFEVEFLTHYLIFYGYQYQHSGRKQRIAYIGR